MGAIPYGGGTTFRVWAPSCASVAIAGTFNGWDPGAAPLAPEGGGYWSRDVTGASPGEEYKFVLRGPHLAGPLWKNDPYARSMTGSTGNSIIVGAAYPWQVPAFVTPSWNDLVIYELHVGTFRFAARSPPRRGNFDTVIAGLDDLQDLGISAIHLMPADEFPGDVSWGYNPAQIFAIEESYGGPTGLRRLVDAAHARGIAVLFDVVYNHLGPADLDLWQFDGWTPGGRSDEGGIYFYNDWRKHTPWGDTRPDYGRGEVRQYLRDNALHWLEHERCDGLRWDATGWIRNVLGSNRDPGADLADGWRLMQWINAEIRQRAPGRITIAEDMHDNEWLTRDVAAGGAGFGSQWGAGFLHALRDAIVPPDDAARDVAKLASLIGQRFNGDAFARVVYTESHDEVAGSAGQARVPELIWPGNGDSYFSQKRSTLGAGLVLTVPGIPMLFMGQEFLEAGAWSDARELDWSRARRFAGIRLLYRDLIRLRRNQRGTTAGLRGASVHVHHVNEQDKVIAFHRWDRGGPGDDVVVIANLSSRAFDAYRLGFPRAGLWQVRLNSDWSGYSPAFTNHRADPCPTLPATTDEMPVGGEVSIGPYTLLILSQDE